jgi:hypothetical protein
MKCLKFENIAEAIHKGTERYKDPHQALRCKVLGGSLKLRLSVDFPAFKRGAGPYKLVAVNTKLRHLCTQI